MGMELSRCTFKFVDTTLAIRFSAKHSLTYSILIHYDWHSLVLLNMIKFSQSKNIIESLVSLGIFYVSQRAHVVIKIPLLQLHITKTERDRPQALYFFALCRCALLIAFIRAFFALSCLKIASLKTALLRSLFLKRRPPCSSRTALSEAFWPEIPPRLVGGGS